MVSYLLWHRAIMIPWSVRFGAPGAPIHHTPWEDVVPELVTAGQGAGILSLKDRKTSHKVFHLPADSKPEK